MRNATLCIGLCCGLSIAGTATASSAEEFSSTIQLAAQQRTLAQQMATDFVLISMNQDVLSNRNELRNNIETFERNHQRLAAGHEPTHVLAPSGEKLSNRLTVVGNTWEAYRGMLEQSLQTDLRNSQLTEMHQSISTFSDQLSEQTNICTQMYVKDAANAGFSGPAKSVNFTARQQMLSEKIAKQALLSTSDSEFSQEIAKDLRKSMMLFEISMDSLTSGDESLGFELEATPRFSRKMQEIQNTFVQYADAVNAVSSEANNETIEMMETFGSAMSVAMTEALTILDTESFNTQFATETTEH